MNRLRKWSVYAGLLLLLPLTLAGHRYLPAALQDDSEKWLVDMTLNLSAQAAPVPALKFRLYPLAVERKEGNAVPIYLRLAHERSDADRRQWTEAAKWSQMPIDQVPILDAKALIDAYQNLFRQLELGARRKTAEWDYTLDQGSVVDIRLADAQSMRHYAHLLSLKARTEMLDGNYSAAARTLETGLAFSRHVAEGPFLINNLVGIACAGLFLHRVPELISQPDAPNLYWALSALPRPLIDMRNALEFEQRVPEMQMPELADLSRERTPEQWDAVLRRVRTEIERLRAFELGQAKNERAGTAPGDPAANSPDLDVAKRYLVDRQGLKATIVNKMPPAQVLVLFLAGLYREMSDDLHKAMYLPYVEGRPLLLEAETRLHNAQDNEATQFARLWLPSAVKARAAQNRLQRQVALYRTIEALRLHAAAHDCRLPDKLSDVKAVPVPNDPGTGKPFDYRRDGAMATISSRLPDAPLENTGLRYRLVMRCK